MYKIALIILAVAELNTNFITLQTEQETMLWQQRDLQQSHDLLAADLAVSYEWLVIKLFKSYAAALIPNIKIVRQ